MSTWKCRCFSLSKRRSYVSFKSLITYSCYPWNMAEVWSPYSCIAWHFWILKKLSISLCHRFIFRDWKTWCFGEKLRLIDNSNSEHKVWCHLCKPKNLYWKMFWLSFTFLLNRDFQVMRCFPASVYQDFLKYCNIVSKKNQDFVSACNKMEKS